MKKRLSPYSDYAQQKEREKLRMIFDEKEVCTVCFGLFPRDCLSAKIALLAVPPVGGRLGAHESPW